MQLQLPGTRKALMYNRSMQYSLKDSLLMRIVDKLKHSSRGFLQLIIAALSFAFFASLVHGRRQTASSHLLVTTVLRQYPPHFHRDSILSTPPLVLFF